MATGRLTGCCLCNPAGRHGQALLALEAFSKKTQKTPPAKIDQAERRLVEWRKRGTQF